MSHYLFNVVIEADPDEAGNPGYHAYCPALKGCHTQADSYEQALDHIREAVELYVEDLVACGEAIPIAPIDSNKHSVAVSAPSVLVQL